MTARAELEGGCFCSPATRARWVVAAPFGSLR